MVEFEKTRATHWRLRTRTLQFQQVEHCQPAIMGIVNVTPDSFSDGGLYNSTQSAIDQALRLEDAGAAILDIGGESTRPYSTAVEADEELRRVVPVIESLASRVDIPLSIDTSKARVARAAIDLGAEIINDVTGLEGDPAMLELAVVSQVGVCAMHMRGTPQTMQDDPTYSHVVVDIYNYLKERDESLLAAGVLAERICLDPGIGFGKTTAHNVQLLSQAEQFLSLGRPILIGHSRKGFIGKMLKGSPQDRDAGTLGISLAMATKGIHVIRVHDVQATVAALTCFRTCVDRLNQ